MIKSKILGLITTLNKNIQGVEFRAFTTLKNVQSDIAYYEIGLKLLNSTSLSLKHGDTIMEFSKGFIRNIKNKSHVSYIDINVEIV